MTCNLLQVDCLEQSGALIAAADSIPASGPVNPICMGRDAA